MRVEEFVGKTGDLLARCDAPVVVRMLPGDAYAVMAIAQKWLRVPGLDGFTRSILQRLENVIVADLDRQQPGLGRLCKAGRNPANDGAGPGGEVIV